MTAITGEILAPKPLAQAVTPAAAILAAQAPIAPIKDRENASSSDRRQSGSGKGGLDFRAVLSSTTFSELADATSIVYEQASAPRPQRQTRVPDSIPEVISGAEATQLYNASRATNANAGASAQYRAATTSYVKSFFSVEGTYAKPGAALELSI